MKRIFIFSIILISFGTIAKETFAYDKKVKGSGNVVSLKRNVSPFQKIDVDGVFDIYLVQGKEESLVVETDDNIQQYIITKVEGNTLKIRNKNGISLTQTTKMNIYITFRNIYDLKLNGVCNVKGKEELMFDNFSININSVGNVNLKLKSNNLEINSLGVGDCILSGRTKSLYIKLTGVGGVDSERLIADNVSIKSSGVGNTTVYALKELNIYTSGVGNVTYYGDAQIKSINSSGVGKIKKMK